MCVCVATATPGGGLDGARRAGERQSTQAHVHGGIGVDAGAFAPCVRARIDVWCGCGSMARNAGGKS